MEKLTYLDLFCGIGGFRIAANRVFSKRGIEFSCVFSSDIDPDAQTSYEANFDQRPGGNIRAISTSEIPDHDLLFAGFPCQPFSIMGSLRGFEDTRGTLFFEIARIIAARKPKAFVLENVKQLVGHDEGRTLNHILEVLLQLGYQVDYKVLNALHFGLPQKRERVFIVGFLESTYYQWPHKFVPMRALEEILEPEVALSYVASDLIKSNRLAKYTKVNHHRTIWHENKGGHISANPFSCALRAGASYNYLLVDGERRLTEREMLRLQGFPDDYKITGGYSAMRKLIGNSVAIPVVEAVLESVVDAMLESKPYEQQMLQSTFSLAENRPQIEYTPMQKD